MRDERSIALDLIVEIVQPIAVPVDREPRNRPHDQAEEVDDRTDVVERRSQPFFAQVAHDETGTLGA